MDMAETQPIIIGGRWRLIRLLGRGGMGEVHLGRDLTNGSSVAVKTLAASADEVAADGTLWRLFAEEARLLQSLQHPNLPRVLAFFEEDGVQYLVMEYVSGDTLSDVLQQEGPQEEQRVLGWGRQLCEILADLHGLEPPVIFRDLKPSNVMLRHDGTLMLIDVGIAKASADSKTCTVARGLVTPGFSPPEQYEGGTDASSDLYALGATLYCLLIGEQPPSALDVAGGKRARLHVRDLAPHISAGAGALIDQLLEIDRDKRPRSAAEVAARLSALVNVEPATHKDNARPAGYSTPLLLRRAGGRWAAVVLFVLLSLGGARYSVTHHFVRLPGAAPPLPPPLGVPTPEGDQPVQLQIQAGRAIGSVSLGMRIDTFNRANDNAVESQFEGERMLYLPARGVGIIPRDGVVDSIVLAPYDPKFLRFNHFDTPGGVNLGSDIEKAVREFGPTSDRFLRAPHEHWRWASKGIDCLVSGGRVRVIKVFRAAP
jgi:hypothetical protein